MKPCKKTHHTLTFEWNKEREELEIHTDQEGLKILQQKIEFLLSINGNDHIHLMSETWGGSEITNKKQSEKNEMINIVKIFKWN